MYKIIITCLYVTIKASKTMYLRFNNNKSCKIVDESCIINVTEMITYTAIFKIIHRRY